MKKTTTTRYTEYYDLQSTFDKLHEDSTIGKNFHELLGIITSKENILLAYRNIKANTGSNTVGTDGLNIRQYKMLDENEFVTRIKGRIMDYKPQPIRRVNIPKPNGDTRPLGIPTMEDRLIQQAIKQVLEPICEAKFFKHSYGFRPNRSTHHAIARAAFLVNMGLNHYVVDIDIKGFFDNVNHNKLIKQLYTLGIRDKQLLSVIKKMLKAEVEGEVTSKKGVPQGGILSPLLSNIVLNELDNWVANQWETFDISNWTSKDTNKPRIMKTTNLKQGFLVRYADDFKIFTKSRNEAIRWYHATKEFLKKRLGLDISEEKSKITNLRKRRTDFLGFSLKAVKRKNKYVAHTFICNKNKEKIIEKIKQNVKELWRTNSRKQAYDYNAYMRGVHNYYKAATHVAVDFKEIAYRTYRMTWNRLKKRKRGEYGYFDVKGYERYNYITFKIADIPLIPVPAIKSQVITQLKQEINNYTENGRQLKDKYSLPYAMQKAVNYLAKTYIRNRSIEYNDNRISRFSAAKGKCAVTGIDLTNAMNFYHCHHIVPVSMGGTDEYKNLVVLHSMVHTLIHATKAQTIKIYLDALNLNEQSMKKVNNYRKKCKLEPIKQ